MWPAYTRYRRRRSHAPRPRKGRPLTASTLEPVATDQLVPASRKAKLDRLYEAVDKALRQLSQGVGIAA